MSTIAFTKYSNERCLLIQDINELERRSRDADLHIAKYDFLSQNHNCRFYKTEKKAWVLEKMKLESALEERYYKLRQLVNDYRSAIKIEI